jgi:hypothetical protein
MGVQEPRGLSREMQPGGCPCEEAITAGDAQTTPQPSTPALRKARLGVWASTNVLGVRTPRTVAGIRPPALHEGISRPCWGLASGPEAEGCVGLQLLPGSPSGTPRACPAEGRHGPRKAERKAGWYKTRRPVGKRKKADNGVLQGKVLGGGERGGAP